MMLIEIRDVFLLLNILIKISTTSVVQLLFPSFIRPCFKNYNIMSCILMQEFWRTIFFNILPYNLTNLTFHFKIYQTDIFRITVMNIRAHQVLLSECSDMENGCGERIVPLLTQIALGSILIGIGDINGDIQANSQVMIHAGM